MGFVGNLFGGNSGMGWKAQSGLQQGQLEDTYAQQQDAIRRQQEFATAVAAQGGLGNQAQVFQQQQQLAQQLQQMGQGQGPSAAQAMLAQQAGNIGAQQAALAASQRGASQNVGLVGRQAAMAGMGAQQQAAGQAATLRAQEQMQALEQLRLQQMGMGQVAGQQVAQQAQATGALSSAALQAQQQALGAVAHQQAAQAGIEQQTAQKQGGMFGQLLGAVGPALSVLAAPATGGASLMAGEAAPLAEGMSFAAKGGEIPSHEMFIKHILGGSRMAYGEKVPGKAEVKGDSLKNDKVPVMLSPGEIVVPRSSAGNPDKAAQFAKAVAMKSKRKKK
jgi:hypothetical protein